MKIVVPMAGRGRRFADPTGLPKPLVPVAGRPMVQWALESISGIPSSEIVFVVLAEHEEHHRISEVIRDWAGGRKAVVLEIAEVTEGQLSTVLAARDLIQGEEDVLVASCDTFVRSELGSSIADRSPSCRGIISVARKAGEHWSFARTDPNGQVVEVAEKRRISDLASTGLYYFSNGREFVSVADEMIARDERARGEFYVIPVYQRYVDRGWRVDIDIADDAWDMGTPKGAVTFERHLIAHRRRSDGERS